MLDLKMRLFLGNGPLLRIQRKIRAEDLDRGRTFEMWTIGPDGKPAPAGTFDARPDSTGVHVHPGPVGNVTAMAISIEPSGGSAQPTTTPIVISKL